MRIAILADMRPSYVRPLGEGLARMLHRVGAEPDLVQDGLESLPGANRIHAGMTAGQVLRAFAKRAMRASWYKRLLDRLRRVDAVVIVNHMPVAYQEWLFDDDRLRSDLPDVPIGLYDLAYLPTRGPWAARLLSNDPQFSIPPGRHRGLDRYDFHLCITDVSENCMPVGCGPHFTVGINLESEDLRVEPGRALRALIDFERPDHAAERRVQLRALERAGIRWTELSGRYSMAEIRRVYRSCGLYFIAHRESFGLPICELQACGALVFTPYDHWCPSHTARGGSTERILPRNFIVYDNDEGRLVQLLAEARATFDPARNRASFAEQQPQFLHGDLGSLRRFIGMVQSGEINARSHERLPSLAALDNLIAESARGKGLWD